MQHRGTRQQCKQAGAAPEQAYWLASVPCRAACWERSAVTGSGTARIEAALQAAGQWRATQVNCSVQAPLAPPATTAASLVKATQLRDWWVLKNVKKAQEGSASAAARAREAWQEHGWAA